MPLYLYDHSGITISTGSFSCPWDSGQVGWVYADRKMIEEEYGKCDKNSMTRTREVLELEVNTYDDFLTGQCFGFRYFVEEDEVDSCWGFLGDADNLVTELPSHIGEENQDLIDALSHCQQSTIEEYFWRNRLSA